MAALTPEAVTSCADPTVERETGRHATTKSGGLDARERQPTEWRCGSTRIWTERKPGFGTMGNVRIFTLARDLRISSTEVVDRLKRLGIEAKTASSSVDEDAADKLRRILKIDQLTAGKRRIYGSDDDGAPRVEESSPAVAAPRSTVGATPTGPTPLPLGDRADPTRPGRPPVMRTVPIAHGTGVSGTTDVRQPRPAEQGDKPARTQSSGEERLRPMWKQVVVYLDSDPQAALMQARKVLEVLLQMMVHGGIRRGPKDGTLDTLRHRVQQRVPTLIYHHIDAVRRYGNLGAHPIPDAEVVDAGDVLPTVHALRAVLRWYCRERNLDWQPDERLR